MVLFLYMLTWAILHLTTVSIDVRVVIMFSTNRLDSYSSMGDVSAWFASELAVGLLMYLVLGQEPGS
jgi:hypothetical protein